MGKISQNGLVRPGVFMEKQKKEEQILTVATTLFAKAGYDKMDVQGLADCLGMGKGTIYRHFNSKEDLFLAAAERAIRLLHESIESKLVSIHDPREKMKKGIVAFLEFFEKKPEFAELLIQDRAVFKNRADLNFFQYRETLIQKWRGFFEDLVKQKIARNLDSEKIVNLIASFLYGMVYMRFFSIHSENIFQQADQLVDILFQGILHKGNEDVE